MELEDKEKSAVNWQKLKIESQQKEMEQLKKRKAYYKRRSLINKNLLQDSLKEIEELKVDLAIHKGISDGKSIIIKQLETQLKR